jgi:hypothetical protein
MSGHLTGFAQEIRGFLTWPWSIWPPEMAEFCHNLSRSVTSGALARGGRFHPLDLSPVDVTKNTARAMILINMSANGVGTLIKI